MRMHCLLIVGAVLLLALSACNYSAPGASPPMDNSKPATDADSPGSPKNATVENPYINAKIGDWASYKITTTTTTKFKVTGPESSTSKTTVIARTDKELTTKTVVTETLNGKESVVREFETKIDLTGAPADLKRWSGGKLEKEKITVGGKEFDCTRSKLSEKGKVYNFDTRSDEVIWFSKLAPLGGLVKSVSKSYIADTVAEHTLELTASGSK